MRKALKRQSLFVLFCIYGGGKKVKVFDTFRFRNADASFQFGLTFRFADYTFASIRPLQNPAQAHEMSIAPA